MSRVRPLPASLGRRMSLWIPAAVYERAFTLRLHALDAGVDWSITQILRAALEAGMNTLTVTDLLARDDAEGGTR